MSTEEFLEIRKKVGNVEFPQQEMKLKQKTSCKKFTEHRKPELVDLEQFDKRKKTGRHLSLPQGGRLIEVLLYNNSSIISKTSIKVQNCKTVTLNNNNTTCTEKRSFVKKRCPISITCISPCSKLKKEPEFLQQKTLVCLIEVLLNAILDNKLSLTHILNGEVYTGVKWMKINHFWSRRKSKLGVSWAIIYSDLRILEIYLFLERGIILNAIFLKKARSKFGNPGRTYPPKSQPSTPPGGVSTQFSPLIKTLR